MRFMFIALALTFLAIAVAVTAYLFDAWATREWSAPAISLTDIIIAECGIVVLALIGAYRD